MVSQISPISQKRENSLISILLLDSHEIVRKGIRSLLESDPAFTIVAESGDGVEALKLVENLRPQIVVLELMLKGASGLELIQNIGSCSVETRVVVLSTLGSEVSVIESLRVGARAYVLKESNVEELTMAIHRVAAGQIFLCSSLAQHAFDIYSSRKIGNRHGDAGNNGNEDGDPYNLLSIRERQILHLVVQENMSSSMIADRLIISRRTVESHRANIKKKLGVNSYSGLMRYGIQRGILPLIGGGKSMDYST